MVKFLNYTTSVPVDRSVQQIQKILVAHGATSIIINYEGELPASLSFMVGTQYGSMPFRLPANVAGVRNIMVDNRLPGYTKASQPHRVAWRVLKDWVEAQMAIIEAGMAPPEEVFLPYLVTADDTTLFQVMKDRRFLLGDGKSS